MRASGKKATVKMLLLSSFEYAWINTCIFDPRNVSKVKVKDDGRTTSFKRLKLRNPRQIESSIKITRGVEASGHESHGSIAQ